MEDYQRKFVTAAYLEINLLTYTLYLGCPCLIVSLDPVCNLCAESVLGAALEL